MEVSISSNELVVTETDKNISEKVSTFLNNTLELNGKLATFVYRGVELFCGFGKLAKGDLVLVNGFDDNRRTETLSDVIERLLLDPNFITSVNIETVVVKEYGLIVKNKVINIKLYDVDSKTFHGHFDW